MNLDSVLQDPSRSAALVDHDWMVEGLIKDGEPNYDPSENYRDNNKKDDLEVEWGYGTIQPTFSDEDVRVPAGGVNRNLPPDALGDAGPVIIFARDLMNRGVMGADLQLRLRSNFEQSSLKLAAGELRELFSMEGIIGCFAVDTRGYADPRQAIAAIQGNPYKHFIKYVIAAARAEDDYLWLPDSRGQQIASDAETSGNAIDDFFSTTAADEKAKGYKPKLIPHCQQTMMPLYAGMGDLDESTLDSTLIELMNVTGLPDAKKEEIVNNDKYATRTAKLQEAFRWLNRQASAQENVRYAERVDATEFLIKTQDQDIEFAEDTSMPDLDIDPVNHCLQNQFDIDPALAADAPLDVSIFGEMTDVILAGQSEIDLLDVHQAEAFNRDLEVNPERVASPQMRIQEREIDGMSIFDESIQLTGATTPEISGLHHSLTIPVDRAPERKGDFDLFEESNGQMDSLIEFGENDLFIAELDAPLEIDLNPAMAMDAAIDVDLLGGEMEFGLVDEIVAQDVSMAQHEDPMFVGTDIDYNERPSRPGDLEIELGSSMEW